MFAYSDSLSYPLPMVCLNCTVDPGCTCSHLTLTFSFICLQEPGVSYGSLFRVGETAKGVATYTPRLLTLDLKGSVAARSEVCSATSGSTRRQCVCRASLAVQSYLTYRCAVGLCVYCPLQVGSLYGQGHDMSTASWEGVVQVHNTARDSPSAYHQHLDDLGTVRAHPCPTRRCPARRYHILSLSSRLRRKPGHVLAAVSLQRRACPSTRLRLRPAPALTDASWCNPACRSFGGHPGRCWGRGVCVG